MEMPLLHLRALAPLPFLTFLLISLPVAKPQAPQAEAPPKSKPDNSKLKSQFVELARLLSMNDDWGLEQLDEERVTKTLKHVHELAEMKFDAAPVLQSLGPEIIKHYLEAEPKVVPQIRASPGARNGRDARPVLVPGQSGFFENEQLRVWQKEHDAFCRSSYQNLLNLARDVALAEKPLPRTPTIQIGVDGQGAAARIVVMNDSEVTLKNVTIVLDLTSIDVACTGKPAADADAGRHLYFLPALPKGRTPVRLSSAWWYIGACGAVGGKFEVIADGFAQSSNRFNLPDNIQPIATKLRDEAQRAVEQLPKEPTMQIEEEPELKLALDRLTVIKRLRSYDSSLQDLAEPVRVKLQEVLKAQAGVAHDRWSQAADAATDHKNQRDEFNKRNQVKEWTRELKRLEEIREKWDLKRKSLGALVQATKDLK